MRTNIGPFCAVPGTDISDVSSRYDTMPFDDQRPAMPVGATQRLCGATLTLSGQLAAGDLHVQRQIRLKERCQSSPAMYLYNQDVHAIELAGPGPHQLELDSCGHAPFGMALMVYQRPGSSAPYDTSSLGTLCRNMIASATPSGRTGCAGGIATRFVGLQPGTVYLVVSSDSPETTGAYDLTVKSSTSACP
jgi:hypothetical protein